MNNLLSVSVAIWALIILAGMNCNNTTKEQKKAPVSASVGVTFDVLELQQSNLARRLCNVTGKVNALDSASKRTLKNPIWLVRPVDTDSLSKPLQ